MYITYNNSGDLYKILGDMIKKKEKSSFTLTH